MFPRRSRAEIPSHDSKVETLSIKTGGCGTVIWSGHGQQSPTKNTVSKPECMQIKNTKQICDGLRLILGMPEMCDVKFLVGKTQTPVYAVKAILATRSPMFYNMIQSHKLIADAKAAVPKKGKGMFSKLRRITKKGITPLRKTKKSSDSLTDSSAIVIPVTDFELDIFRRVILYLHSGSVNVDVTSVIGVMTAADVYGIYSLRKACLHLAVRYVTVKTVLPLLASSETYERFKWTTVLLNKILEFIASKASEILQLPDFEFLPKRSVKAILFRDDLRATDEIKWDAALQWSRQYCHLKEISVFRETIAMFIPHIDFIKIRWSKLKREILPLNVLPEDVVSRVLVTCCPPPKPPRQGARRSPCRPKEYINETVISQLI